MTLYHINIFHLMIMMFVLLSVVHIGSTLFLLYYTAVDNLQSNGAQNCHNGRKNAEKSLTVKRYSFCTDLVKMRAGKSRNKDN